MDSSKAKSMIKQYVGFRKASDLPIVDAAAQRMVERGECVYHACAVVTSKPCWCHDCKGMTPCS